MKQFKIMEKKMVKVALTENLFFTVTEDLDNAKWKTYDIHLHRKAWGRPTYMFGESTHDQTTGKKKAIETVAEEVYNLFTETDYAVPSLEDLIDTPYECEYEVFRTYFKGLADNEAVKVTTHTEEA